jgi:serralysin
MAATKTIPMTSPTVHHVDALGNGLQWNDGTTLTFQIPDNASDYGASYGSTEPNTFVACTANQRTFIRAMIALVNARYNLNITEVFAPDSGVIRFGKTDSSVVGSTAVGYGPSTGNRGGDVWFKHTGGTFDNPTKGSYSGYTHWHELGHALGMKHPHTITQWQGNTYPVMDPAIDEISETMMSYRAWPNRSVSPPNPLAIPFGNYPWTYMGFDHDWMVHVYGAKAYNNTDTTWHFNSATGEVKLNGVSLGVSSINKVNVLIVDTGGTDNFDLSSYNPTPTINYTPGAWSTLSSTQLPNMGEGHSAPGCIRIAGPGTVNIVSAAVIEGATQLFVNDSTTFYTHALAAVNVLAAALFENDSTVFPTHVLVSGYQPVTYTPGTLLKVGYRVSGGGPGTPPPS